MSLSHPDRHRLLAERPAELPELQRPVLATRKLRPRSTVIAALGTDDLPVLGHGFYPSVWKNGVLVDREAPDHRVVRRSFHHASQRPNARTWSRSDQYTTPSTTMRPSLRGVTDVLQSVRTSHR